MSTKPRTHRFPSGPLVLDTRSLGRNPSATMEVRRGAAVPTTIGVEMIAIPEGSELDLDLTLTFVDEGILVTGSVTGSARVECARCLGEFRTDVGVDLTEMYAIEGKAAADAEEDEVRLLDGDMLDLEPALIDAFGLEFPLSPTCTDYGHETCINPDIPAPDGVSGDEEGRIDPRWAGLADKFGSLGSDEEGK
ncbi:DNA-binding protein [Dietzia sp. NCCP-2495]|uniref:YceD family protein n=1 Tax=Dietzia sp. NCCP-2495 TaxID=2934675 RepID=UPI0022320974|nr:DUF177 domain-containing protein [Dietzia sp. NCCP-2495]GLB62422.1 DNA-binding protein [Dietzia sp. NCCP-2495]